MSETETKTCAACQEALPLEAFSRRKLSGGRYGLRSVCRSCRSLQRSPNKRRAGDTHKRCPSCERTLELLHFYNRSDGRGVRSWCYECELEKKRQRREETSGERRAALEAAREAAAAVVIESGMKTCTCCGETLPVHRFHVSQRTRDGYKTQCSICVNIKRKGVEPEDEDRVRTWSAREAMLRDLADNAPKRWARQEGACAWDEEEEA
jgi:hypothetical protein